MSFRFYTRPLVLLIGLTIVQCQLPPPEPVILGYDYFPLETGRYSIYDVQENQYAVNAIVSHQAYQLKEVTGSAYIDVTGQTAYRLIRYRRNNDSQPWQADSVWSARLVNNEGIRTENGRAFVSLLFPISNGLSWNGNQHNALNQNDYTARNVGRSFSVLTEQFNDTVTVVAQDDSTLVDQKKRIEVYARQVGLIYKERTYLQFCTATPTCVGQKQIDYGIRQVYQIRTYGKE